MRLDLVEITNTVADAFPTLEHAAEWFGTSAQSVSNWKKGRQRPDTIFVQKALDAYMKFRPPEDFIADAGKVVILMPILRTVEAKTFASINRMLAEYGRDQVELMVQVGTDIDRARCILADRAYEAGARWMVFIDSDAIPPCGYGPLTRGMGYNLPEPNASLNALARIMTAPPEKEIVSALCYMRRHPMTPACSTGVAGGPTSVELIRRRDIPGETGFEEQDWVGMHFCRISRTVLEKMREKADDFPEIKPRNPRDPWGYFMKQSSGNTEDGSFCLRAKALGIQSWIDTTLRVGHIVASVV